MATSVSRRSRKKTFPLFVQQTYPSVSWSQCSLHPPCVGLEVPIWYLKFFYFLSEIRTRKSGWEARQAAASQASEE